jgi:adenylylsulfate kinase
MLNAKRLNADEVRKEANDWDFSEEGRKRQARRMADFAKKLKEGGNFVVADFVCPTPEARALFPADFIIWVDTIKEGRFDDTNKMFVKPDKFDYHVTTQDAKNWAPKNNKGDKIMAYEWDNKKPTAQMLGKMATISRWSLYFI